MPCLGRWRRRRDGSGANLVPVPILLYHKVTDVPGSMATSPALFEAHLSWLKSSGFVAISLAEFEDHLAKRGKHDKPVMITFDDGFRCMYERAWGILRRLNMKASAFLVTGLCGADAEFLNWNQILEIVESGIIEFQSHSHSHDNLILSNANLSAALDDIARSRAVLVRELSVPQTRIVHFAWPWGFTSPPLERLCEQAGFRFQYLVQTAVACDARHGRLPRLCCDGWPLSKLSRRVTALTTPFLGGAINALSGFYRRARGQVGY